MVHQLKKIIKLKKICIALDTSPSAEKVATLGYENAKALKAEVVIVHVVSDAGLYAMDYDPIMEYNGFLIQKNVAFIEDLEGKQQNFLKPQPSF
ncbi:universal stress protein [Bizionia arctica]|uniref:UspA domain-containing protein n=1 Tax=Bizionia arctica TaxID=1495645 RepID=A0A917LPI8_9FLAO|nr:universal stress protein [Bizionia arctica]GGG49113.1 hypothetical protein GCM10010976_20560 [Bizionia arctica]